MNNKDIKIMCRECNFLAESYDDLLFSDHTPYVTSIPQDDYKTAVCPRCGTRGRFRIAKMKRTDSS